MPVYSSSFTCSSIRRVVSESTSSTRRGVCGDHVLHVEWRTQNAKLGPAELAWINADGDVGAERTAAVACGSELRRQVSVGIPSRDVVTDPGARHRLRDTIHELVALVPT